MTEEPLKKLEEILRDKVRKPVDERHELSILLSQEFPIGSREYEEIQKQLQNLKERISKKHNDLMEILKAEDHFTNHKPL